MAQDYCQVCGLQNQNSENADSIHLVRVTCSRCGTFVWDPTTPWSFQVDAKARQVRLSAFIRRQNISGITPCLNPELISQVERMPVPRLGARALIALTTMAQEVGYDANILFKVSDDLRMQAISYSANLHELLVLMKILESQSLVGVMGRDIFRILPDGYIKAEEFSQEGGQYLQGFVAMSFESSMNDAYSQGFDPAIRNAGYNPLRIDGKEHINGISDEILTEIKRSRFLVADYTGMNNGVYFEAGVAIGLGIPVIPTCRVDYIDKLHFDIRHINTIKWENPSQLARDLNKRISAVIGDAKYS